MSNDIEALRAGLERGLAQMALPDATELVAPLLHYIGQLQKWNKAYNLTAVRDPAEMLTRHLLDSYSVLPYISGTRIIDVGTGPGLPGIPLALAMPQAEFVLLDSNGKKVRFLEHVAAELGLHNVTSVQARVGDYTAGGCFDTVVCRAFTSLAEFVANSGHLAEPDGRLVAMKGRKPEDELSGLPADWSVVAIDALQVPGLVGERHVVVLRRAT